ncbi:carbon-nitrogen hydrolase family protein [Paraburkholderia caribensis]|uniref:Acyltransferase n=1 Tax=Paraburkholderia caribensis TaxID=75105 RepID=A0A9Q6WL49_9BURK|nr:carbon-nitrogen hydrolase family protein [Paraburkholderia caribensis]ALP61478.1 acyltransferase [Paraburkholderia caribensis]AUT50401.1 carbon-nitrogen hydrolase family protein [Paraburkholderia caribensis]MCO4875903.1 carbon-nitrogen hydrolase family protein [Paraburkholderia caribensis]PTB29591.1 carbon-nitrogen hydrolase family protein [Paraburkholderia caribensis]QLB62478.1 acyltransferase [Paraburkholderia caribensis]
MMQESIKAAVVQMSSSADVEQNLGEARRWAHQAARDGATLICLPEYFCWIGDDEMQRVALAEAFGDGPIQQALSELARETGAWLIGGTVPIRPSHGSQAGTHAYNTSLVFDPSGRCSARYDKIHLFSFNQGAEQHAEGDTMVGGDSIGTAQGPFGTLRLSVCYDLRFPELYRAEPAADVIAVPAAFTYTTGLAHWELLLRARAVENQAFVLASGQCGTHSNGWRTFGHSMIVGPWGEVLARHDDEPGIALATLTQSALDEARNRLPVLTHRRIATPSNVR